MSNNYLILGLARSGIAALRWLLQKGHTVYVSDNDLAKVAAAVAEGGIAWTDESDFKKLTALIQSPGIPLTHPLTMTARAHGLPVLGDIDLFCQAHPAAKILGITGTNGKSTITTLIGHILKECDIPVAIGGNVGVAAMSLPDLPDKGVYVLELSSYQLDLSQSLSLFGAAWSNITPDHLERHGTLENYVYAKSKIFASKAAPPLTTICIDDLYSKEIYERMNEAHPGYFTPISVNRLLAHGVFVFEGMLIDATGEERLNLGDISNLERLKGAHNYQNIAIAYTVCKNLGLNVAEIVSAIKTFPGLAHRQEYVAVSKGVTFINDSKATNAEATVHALSAYDSIHWIVGGVAKSEGITPLVSLLPRVKKAYLIGESSDQFAQTLTGHIPWENCGTLLIAVKKAYADAQLSPGSTLLLSPACASFDQFRDFEHRGEVFKEIVKETIES
ncbi:MAG: UDP-N-acetylmuramoyl-L-alanine--D-glutamate ligase [Candidatus Paracaedibacteraceae bacterium]|nr:UDP-N-acetylmuramoyl-L-alanine--D-glutamate ligase [Candidatus Paracaedibacteraceae bacterium]